jgi:hypothetical protein
MAAGRSPRREHHHEPAQVGGVRELGRRVQPPGQRLALVQQVGAGRRDPADTGQRDQPRARQQPLDLPDLAAPADEAAQVTGQVAGLAGGRRIAGGGTHRVNLAQRAGRR